MAALVVLVVAVVAVVLLYGLMAVVAVFLVLMVLVAHRLALLLLSTLPPETLVVFWQPGSAVGRVRGTTDPVARLLKLTPLGDSNATPRAALQEARKRMSAKRCSSGGALPWRLTKEQWSRARCCR